MSLRKPPLLLWCGLGSLFLALIIFLWPATQANAQCGSQASSCKNCHEVQAQDPVNNDGTGWHQSHAFGDFCYICHAGNNQSMDKATAHTGMVDPLSDIQAACASCHPNDLVARAEVYAKALGVTLNAGAATPAAGGATTGGQVPTPTAGGPTQPAESTAPATAGGLVGTSGEVIDYNQRYAELALGKRPINWGNLILSVLIVVLLAGGGAFVYLNERRLRGLPLRKARISSPKAAGLEAPVVEGYPAEVTALLPKIARLNPVGLHALKRLLENPEPANELLHSLSKLDPELVNRVRSLDRSSRELLLALSGD